MINRRKLFVTAFGTFAARPNLALGRARRRVTQGELDDSIALHRQWLDDRSLGRRANFESCDLSGLDFGINVEHQVVLRNADFTDADLNGIEGNDVNFQHASLQYANLAGSHLKAPVFSNATLNGADCRGVLWGSQSATTAFVAQQKRPEPAVFMNTLLSNAVFDRARIRGYFYDCSLAAASFEMTDLSQSHFAGPFGANRFAMARLIETSFRHTRIDGAVFRRAVIIRADFLGANLAPHIAHHLRERDVIHVSGRDEHVFIQS